MNPLHWIISGLALIGVLLNIKKHWGCFVLWAFTNAAWMIVDADHGLIAQAVLQGIYMCLSIYGFVEWSTRPQKKENIHGKSDPR
jgi:hypothetical protein